MHHPHLIHLTSVTSTGVRLVAAGSTPAVNRRAMHPSGGGKKKKRGFLIEKDGEKKKRVNRTGAKPVVGS
jgi:hypothetical protein